MKKENKEIEPIEENNKLEIPWGILIFCGVILALMIACIIVICIFSA